ncbi:2-oxoglutarate dehydrogenase E1 component [Candidatus Erwinia haradaeae]|uniref:oxoglutarate dehydrogenase (succinyl-transferring) n=1 Tax=Candidatus Erwinia haradaeae TaxID=1922217 RepID=A0A451D8W7_9GAMM|nr:2-oxoglutarate dehydrogenase E1 component [Candidatus Erwinia haradaeae]VFP82280.1 2-oxoglutarate dehydrogenase E1 component [Candidatus Erwinia haradaeae]
MQNSTIKSWRNSSWITGANQAYIECLYIEFLTNPFSVDQTWRSIFENISTTNINQKRTCFSSKESSLDLNIDYFSSQNTTEKYNTTDYSVKIWKLINAFRVFGHLNSNTNPLSLNKKNTIPELELSHYHFSDNDLENKLHTSHYFSNDIGDIKLADLYLRLHNTYCGSVGIEYMHLTDSDERKWIQKQVELIKQPTVFLIKEKKQILNDLTKSESFERYIASQFPGAKRFSLEGGDTLIPMLNILIQHARQKNTSKIILGMAHRGRLNTLINVLGKKPQDLFNEFSGQEPVFQGSGDVKYHMGFTSHIKTESGSVHLSLAYNPSHLEIVNPVVMGMTRAHLDHLNKMDQSQILSITIHGDAAISGQGVVQETLNMSKTRGYQVGGTIRIVINNQIGFTTSNPEDSRSTNYCTDVGKMIMAPIFHVNSDDPEAVIFVTRLALDFRYIFQRDVFIDLVCYRRHGHNEADEPSATQPMMYQIIKNHPTTREIYASHLKSEQVITQKDVLEMFQRNRNLLEKGDYIAPIILNKSQKDDSFNKPLTISNLIKTYTNTSNITIDYLKALAIQINTIPKEITTHPRITKIYKNRSEMAIGYRPFDWGAAENLAYATLLDMGISCRLSGEDIRRGTFFHRHAMIHNQSNGSIYCPLKHINENQGNFDIWDSILSEEAVLAFEYGYSITVPDNLTIWEAQFGDFANGAQVVIDQFISCGEQKWGYRSNLVMLLPHGYEGQGPEHSSARLERYLQMCSENNIQVCIPSTPSQLYHMLRRQILSRLQCPLVVISPKSLLRHPEAISSLEDLASGFFELVIKEVDKLSIASLKRIILCSGKVYYDLLQRRRQNNNTHVAILRLEQLYPFPHQVLKSLLEQYSHVKEFIWCQEEPKNQGAWHFIKKHYRRTLPLGAILRYSGRPPSAAPAAGYISLHRQQQEDLLHDALTIKES